MRGIKSGLLNDDGMIILCCLLSYLHTEARDVRLVGGTSHCNGNLEMKHQGEWRPGDSSNWNMKSLTVLCRQLDCGSVVSMNSSDSTYEFGWSIRPSSLCVGTESSLRECVTMHFHMTTDRLALVCSGNTYK